MRVIRTGHRPKPRAQPWSDAEILAAFWELEEQKGGRPNPLNQPPPEFDIPKLTPKPKT